MGLPGRAWHVGTVIWFLAGLKKNCTVRIQYGIGKAAKLNRYAMRRGLAQLESAGLVRVDRKHGRCPIVTILDVVAGK